MRFRRITIEQACPHQIGGYHRWLKRVARRLLRRLAKQNPEEAPTKYRYRGYET